MAVAEQLHDLGADQPSAGLPTGLPLLCYAVLCRQLRALLGGIDDMQPGDAKLLLVMQVVGPLWLPEAGEVAEVRRCWPPCWVLLQLPGGCINKLAVCRLACRCAENSESGWQ